MYRDCGGGIPLPWTRAKAVEYIDRFWKDGRICRFAQDTVYTDGVYVKTDAEIRSLPPRLWSAGAMLAFYGKWGNREQGSRALKAIMEMYGPWPGLRLLPHGSSDNKDSFYPRYAAHVLWGLALHCFGR